MFGRSPARASTTVRIGHWIWPSLFIALAELSAQTLVWTGTASYVDEVGAGNTTIALGTTLNITTPADHFMNGTAVINNGSIKWVGSGAIRGWSGASLTNNNDFEDQNASAVSLYPTYDSNFVFNNSSTGIFTKSGVGTTTFGIAFSNAGNVAVQSGTLILAAGGTNSGSFVTSAGATTRFDTDYTLATGSSLTGLGSYLLNGGTLTISGTATITTLNLAGGLLAGTHTLNSSVLNWTGSGLGTSGTTTIAANSVLNLSSTADHFLNQRALINHGVTNWSDGGALRGWSGASFTNHSQFNDLNLIAASVYATYDSNFFFSNTATGTYTKSGAGTTTYTIPFDNAGAVNVNAGTLALAAGGTNTATITTATGAITRFDTDYSLATGSSLIGSGSYLLNGGTLTASGSLTITTLNLSGGLLAGTHTFNSSVLNWTGSGLGTPGVTTIASSSTLNLTTTADHFFNQRGLVNNGVTNWSGGGALRGWSGASFTNNYHFNDLNTTAASAYATYDGNFSFTNAAAGTYAKSGTGTTTYSVPFTNSGTVNVQAGVLALLGGGTNTSTGAIVTSAGAITSFDADYTLASGSSLTGLGLYRLTNGSLTASGTVTISKLNLIGGLLAGTQTFASSALDWSNSGLGTSGITTIASTSSLAITTSADHFFNQRALINNGTTTWSGSGALRGWSGASFTNNSQFNDQNTTPASVYATYDSNFSFINAGTGTYSKTGAGTTTYSVPFENAGTVHVSAGTLSLAGGGTNTAIGSFVTASGATTRFDTGYALNNNSSLTGPGAYLLAAGTLSADGNITVSNLNLVAGTLAGTQIFLNSTLDWSGASLATAGTTTIAPSSTLSISTSGDHYLNSRTLSNAGTLTWLGNGALRGWDGAAISNTGTFNDQNSGGASVYSTYNSNFSFTNATGGSYNKTGAGTTTFAVSFTNAGSLYVQGGSLVFSAGFTNSNGAVLVSNGASLISSTSLSLGTGTLSGTGTLTAPSISAGGLVSPGSSPGQLNVTGDLTLLSTASSLFEIGGTTQSTTYDFLNVSGNATINGSLAVTFTNGFQASVLNSNVFTIVSAASLTGTFTNAANGAQLLTSNGAGFFQVNYSGTSITLSNFTPVPEPSTYALLAAGLGVLLLASRRRHEQPSHSPLQSPPVSSFTRSSKR